MPFIDTKTNIQITKRQADEIKTRLGSAISDIGKSEDWLMVGFEDNYNLYFRGKNEDPIAMITVSLYGKASADQYNELTDHITEIVGGVLGILPGNIYINYQETDTWGYGGSNF